MDEPITPSAADPKLTPPRTPQTRLLVVEQLIHRTPSGQQAWEGRYGRNLTTDEQPYHRQFTVGPEWQVLECGWVQTAGMLYLTNEEGKDRRTYPNETEKKDLAEKVVEVGAADGEGFYPVRFARVRPNGESARFEPIDLASFRVRCPAGPARCTLTLLPE